MTHQEEVRKVRSKRARKDTWEEEKKSCDRKSAEQWRECYVNEDAKKAWKTKKELSTKRKDMKRFHYSDEGVLQTMVRNVIPARADSNKRERFV